MTASVYTSTYTSIYLPAFGGVVNELAYQGVGRANDDTTLANDVQITRPGGTLQEATDTTSVGMYLFPRVYQRTDVLLESDPEALQYAEWVLHVAKTAEDRFESVTIDTLADVTGLFPQVLARDIGDRITIIRRPPGMAAVTKDCFIRSVTHAISAIESTWVTTWGLQDAGAYSGFLILDSAASGLLNTNVLAY